jgi:hypothetical protein
MQEAIEKGKVIEPATPAPVPAIVEILAPVDIDQLTAAFKKFEDFKSRLLNKEDYQDIGNKKFIKKSGWRKWALACNVSDELLSTERVPATGEDEKGSFYYRVVVRAFHLPTGRQTIGSAIAAKNERSPSKSQMEKAKLEGKEPSAWAHPEHDIYALACTRAKSRAISDLVGGGEVSAEEVEPPTGWVDTSQKH